MLKDIKVTLYDIFGYLLPGIVFLASIVILFWTIFIPRSPLVPYQLTDKIWVLALLVSYFSGHMAQALANILAKLLPSAEDLVLSRDRANNLPKAIIESVKSKASSMIGIDLKEINSEWLYSICDETLVQSGVVEDREVYLYREGFYRGLTVSLFALALSLFLRMVIPGTTIIISSGVSQSISWTILLFLTLISFVGSLLAFLRYMRFARYRVTRAIIGFLALQGKETLENNKGEV